MFVSHLTPGTTVEHPLGPGRGVYLYVIAGDARVNGEAMATGDAAQITDESRIKVEAVADSELILVDVALG
jgi:redox-sensitive bicupin YhaK (pirin superfamily)